MLGLHGCDTAALCTNDEPNPAGWNEKLEVLVIVRLALRNGDAGRPGEHPMVVVLATSAALLFSLFVCCSVRFA
jgi:hypothetical protein